MAFCTDDDRKASILAATSFHPCPFVVRVRTQRGESEIWCDDFEHAYDTATSWKNTHKAGYVEMFRVSDDGTLSSTIGEL